VETDLTAASSAKRPSSRHAGVDGLRGVAVLIVICGHAVVAAGLQLPSYLGFFVQGGRGVTIFFVISGFLITTILLREKRRSGRISAKAFYSRRALRILPAFYTFLLVVVVLSVLPTPVHVDGAQVAAAGLFVWNYAPIEGTWWLGHTWSLAVEEQFYLLWPLAMIFLPLRRLVWVAAAVVLASPVIRVAQYVLLPELRGRTDLMFQSRADMLIIGCLLALTAGSVSWHRVLPVVRRLWPVYVVFLVLVSPILEDRFEGAYRLTVGWTLEAICVAGIIATITTSGSSLLGRALAWRPLVWIGLISYSLYLWQQLFLTALMPAPLSLPWVGIPAAIACATASYWLVEKPFLRLKKRFERGTADFQPGI
jgi:peptidoglycan/LPS O-acetylase OafA/YrhL